MKSLAPLLLTLVACCPRAMAQTEGATGSVAPVRVSTRSELVRAVEQARPGTKILIAPGSYAGGLHFNQLQGAKGRPILLAAADPKRPPVIQGRTCGLHLTDPAHVEIQDLVFVGATGNGINIDDGGSFESPAHHVVLRGLQVRDVGPRGNRDGVKLSGVRDFRVESCTIQRWGDGGSAIDMVGCHDGRVVGCTFRHRGDSAASGVQTKGGSSRIAIQRCRFEQAGGRAVNIGGSTGLPYFRPKKPRGYEAKDITVEDCTFVGSAAPIAFVGVEGAVVRHNTIHRPTRWIVRILQENRNDGFVACRKGVFSNNLIAFRSDELRTAVNVGDGTSPKTFKFVGNYWYCIDRPDRSRRSISLPVNESRGVYGVNPQFEDEPKGDLRLKRTTPVRNAGVRPPG